MMSPDKTPLRSRSRSSLVAFLGLTGAAAGFVAWALVFALHLLFGVRRPGLVSLLLAIPRGALFGVLLALILHWYWHRDSGSNRS